MQWHKERAEEKEKWITNPMIELIRAMGIPKKRTVLENPKLGEKNFRNAQMKENQKGCNGPSDKNDEWRDGDIPKGKIDSEEEEFDFDSEMTNLHKEKEAEKHNEKDDSSTHEQLIGDRESRRL